MIRLSRIFVVMELSLLAGAGVALGAFNAIDKSEHWKATSTTALSVTGDVTFTPEKIQFQNGISLPLTLLKRVTEFKAFGETVTASIYRVTAHNNVLLENGNYLCGSAAQEVPVTYIVLWHPTALLGDKAPRSMAVFSGKEPPRSTETAASCGVYNYEAEAEAQSVSNCVVAFFSGAKLQYKIDDQRDENKRVLRDMLALPPEQLKAARYADDQGHKGTWTARQVLERYFLSTSKAEFNDECFYRDYSKPAARAAIQKQLVE